MYAVKAIIICSQYQIEALITPLSCAISEYISSKSPMSEKWLDLLRSVQSSRALNRVDFGLCALKKSHRVTTTIRDIHPTFVR